MKTVVECPSCRSKSFQSMRGYEEFHLVRCGSCGLAFSNDHPDNRDLSEHYEKYGRDDYQSPITVKRYGQWMDQFEKERKQNRILDIGCGVGYFLEVAKQREWEVYGTEITQNAVDICNAKGIKMHFGDLEKGTFEQGYFDVITSIEVIEHLTDPKAHLEQIHHWLRPGGIVFITTPNFNSLNRRLLKHEWNGLAYPEHLCYFTKQSLHKALLSEGFEKISLTTTGISPERLVTSLRKQKVDASSASTLDESLRKKSENQVFLKIAKRLVNGFLQVTSLGESLKGTYRKLNIEN